MGGRHRVRPDLGSPGDLYGERLEVCTRQKGNEGSSLIPWCPIRSRRMLTTRKQKRPRLPGAALNQQIRPPLDDQEVGRCKLGEVLDHSELDRRARARAVRIIRQSAGLAVVDDAVVGI